MASYTASRSFRILNQGGNARTAIAGEYVNLYCPPSTITQDFTIRFPVSTGGYEIPRLRFAGQFDTSTAILTGLSSVSFYVNSVLVTGLVTLAIGDTLLIRAVLSTVVPGSVLFSVTLANATVGENANTYLWEQWENLSNATILADEWVETNDSLQFNGPTAYDKGAIGKYQITGACTIEFGVTGLRMAGGLSSENPVTFPATLWNRISHAWLIIYPNATIRELGAVPALATTLSNTNILSYLFRVVDTGSAIEYQYSTDNGGSWTTHYTSPSAYTLNTVWHTDVVGYSEGSKLRGVKVTGGAIA